MAAELNWDQAHGARELAEFRDDLNRRRNFV
jgi:hypothetical protein